MPRRIAPHFARLATLVLLGLATVGGPARATAGANDPVFQQSLQWGLERIGAPQAWAASRGAGTTIAIIDSGIDLQHEDLAGKIVASTACVGTGGDVAKCGGSAQDDNGHGTHVAGIAAATTDNHKGVAGVAPDAKLIAVRVLTNQCNESGCAAKGTSGDVAAGIRWATDHGADVINLSLGADTRPGVVECAFCAAVDYAWSKGVILVIAAGNDSLLPAGFRGEPAIVVTATTRTDARASYSNASADRFQSARWPVSAPGGEGESDPSDCATGGTPKGVLSTYWVPDHPNEYACLAGTSMAAPHVSGLLALLLAQGRSPQEAIDRMLGTVHDLGTAGRDPAFGVGLIDAARAVGAGAAAPPTSSPSTSGTTATSVSTTGSPSTDSSSTTTADVPIELPPGSGQASPLGSARERREELPAGLVATAVILVLATAGTTAAAAWRLRPQ